MAIYRGSRYEGDKVVRVLDADDIRRPTVFHPHRPDEFFTFRLHQVVAGDRLDLLAAEAFSDSTLWWVIADVNPELERFDVLVPGSLLRIPVVS